jgi:hypothetical protein
VQHVEQSMKVTGNDNGKNVEKLEEMLEYW